MAVVLFQWSKAKADAVPGLNRIRTLGQKYKKTIIGSVATLALFGTPLAVAAMTSSGTSDTQHSTQSHDEPSEPKTESKDQHDLSSQTNTEVNVHSQTSGSSSDADGANQQVDVTINGQDIKVPPSGHVHKTIKDNNNQTVVDIQIDNDSTSNNSYSSTSINVESESSDEDSRHRRRPVRR